MRWEGLHIYGNRGCNKVGSDLLAHSIEHVRTQHTGSRFHCIEDHFVAISGEHLPWGVL